MTHVSCGLKVQSDFLSQTPNRQPFWSPSTNTQSICPNAFVTSLALFILKWIQ